MTRDAFVLLLATGVLACGAAPARADDGAIENVGGAVRLMKGQGHVRMAREVVRANLSRTRIEVDCVFVMENHGPADTVLVGFPDQSDAGGPGPAMSSFRSWVDGVEVKCDSMPATTDDPSLETWTRWWTKRVYFAAGATRTIRDHYLAAPGLTIEGTQMFEYILRTGASWAGTIGSAEVTVSLGDVDSSWVRYVDPKPRVQGRTLRWTFKDFEPGTSEHSPSSIQVSWWPPEARERWEKGQR